MPKKYTYPEELPKFEVACLVYAAATDLVVFGTPDEIEAIWKPVVARFYKELIFTIDTFKGIPKNTLILEWQISE